MKREQKTEYDGHKAGGKTEWQTPLWLFDLLDDLRQRAADEIRPKQPDLFR